MGTEEVWFHPPAPAPSSSPASRTCQTSRSPWQCSRAGDADLYLNTKLLTDAALEADSSAGRRARSRRPGVRMHRDHRVPSGRSLSRVCPDGRRSLLLNLRGGSAKVGHVVAQARSFGCDHGNGHAQRLHAPRQVAPQPLGHARRERRDDDLVKVPAPHRRLDRLERLRTAQESCDPRARGRLQEPLLCLQRPVGVLRSVTSGMSRANSQGPPSARQRTTSSSRGVDAVRFATIRTCVICWESMVAPSPVAYRL